MGIKGPNKARAREIQHPRDVPCDQNPSLRQVLYACSVGREEKEKKEQRSRGKNMQETTSLLPIATNRNDDPNRLPKQGMYFKKHSLQAVENARAEQDATYVQGSTANNSSAQRSAPTWQFAHQEHGNHLLMLATPFGQTTETAQNPAAPQANVFPLPMQPQNRWFKYARPVASPTARDPPVASPGPFVPLVATVPRVNDRPRQPSTSHVPPPPPFNLQKTPAKPIQDSHESAADTGSGNSGGGITNSTGAVVLQEADGSANKDSRYNVAMSTDSVRPQLPKAPLPETPRYDEGLMRLGKVYPPIPAGGKQTASPARPKPASEAAAGAQQNSSGKSTSGHAAANKRSAPLQSSVNAATSVLPKPIKRQSVPKTPKTTLETPQSETAAKAARKNKPNGGEATPATNKKVNGSKAPAGNSKKKDANKVVAGPELRLNPPPSLVSTHRRGNDPFPTAKTSGPNAVAGNKQQNKAGMIDKTQTSFQTNVGKVAEGELAAKTNASTTSTTSGAAVNSAAGKTARDAAKTADPALENNVPSAHEADTAVAESLLQLSVAPVKGKKKAGSDNSTHLGHDDASVAVEEPAQSATNKTKASEVATIAHKENTKVQAAGDKTTPEVDKVTAHDGDIVMNDADSGVTVRASSPVVPATEPNGSIDDASSDNRHLSLDLDAAHSPESSPEPELRTPHGTRSMTLEPSIKPSFDSHPSVDAAGDMVMLDTTADALMDKDGPATSKEHSSPSMPTLQSESVDVLMSSLSIASVAINTPGAQQNKGKRKEHPATEPGPVPWTQAKKTRTASALIFKAIGMASRNASAKDKAVLDGIEKAWENLFEDE